MVDYIARYGIERASKLTARRGTKAVVSNANMSDWADSGWHYLANVGRGHVLMLKER